MISQKRQKFLLDVMHEIDMLKLHATDAEKAKLNFYEFDYDSPTRCIYGQLTGKCASPRAKELMGVACIRVMHLDKGISSVANVEIDDEKFTINGEYTGQTWDGTKWSIRNYSYLSALEAYIATKDAKNADVIAYIKGEIETLEL